MIAAQYTDALIQRASRIAARFNNAVTGGDEPLVVDLAIPIQGQHWTAYQLSAFGVLATRVPVGNPIPTFGLYMVPATAPPESLADAQINGTIGWNATSRAGIALPYTLSTTRFGAGGGFAFVCTALIQGECILPTGWMFRFIGSCAPGTATPGPGAGSNATLLAHVIEESNSRPQPPANV